MPSAPSSERTSRGSARATRPRASSETPAGIKVVAGLLLVGAIGDAFVGLLAVDVTAILGVVLLGAAVTQLYLAYGLYHLQTWAYRGTVALQVVLPGILLFLGRAAPVVLKVGLVAYLLLRRDAGWY